MGVSTNGILFYGYDLGVFDEEVIAAKLGLDSWDYESWAAANFGEIYRPLDDTSDNLRDYRNERDGFVEGWGVRLGIHCCGDELMGYLYARHYIARRGHPVQITPKNLEEFETPPKNLIVTLGKLLEQGIIDIQDMNPVPGWYLASIWL